MRAEVVVDTNVVVSGILTSEEDAPTARIVDAMLKGSILFLLSVDLLAEYRQVLLRPAIRSRHGLNDEEVDAILTTIAANAVVREPVEPPSLPPDHGDLHLWQILAARPQATLITGDRALLENPPSWARLMNPAGFAGHI